VAGDFHVHHGRQRGEPDRSRGRLLVTGRPRIGGGRSRLVVGVAGRRECGAGRGGRGLVRRGTDPGTRDCRLRGIARRTAVGSAP
jgi:hypothetical protein